MMKKVFVLVLLFMFVWWTVFSAHNGSQCDQVFYKKLRLWTSIKFMDYFNNKSPYLEWISNKTTVLFEEKNNEDLNGGNNPSFVFSNELRKSKYLIPSNTNKLVLISKDFYKVKYHPSRREKDNIYIEYNIVYWQKVNGRWKWPYSHRECVNYEVTRCWDGVVDASDGEKCDPMDKTKKWWWNGGCSTTCQPVTIPQTCNQTFNRKLRHGYTYTFNDYFKNNTWKRVYIASYQAIFDDSKNDVNDGPNPGFDWTNWIKSKNFILNNNEEGKVYETKSWYSIVRVPSKRLKDNIFIKYIAKYYTIDNNGKREWPFYHVECDNNEITWCGDGIVDDYVEKWWLHVHEECDPADPNHTNWWPGGCSNDCHPVTTQPVCNGLDYQPPKNPITIGEDNTTKTVSCTATNASTIKIDCGNGVSEVFSGDVNWSITVQKQCTYNKAGIYNPTCIVNDNITNDNCTKSLTVKTPTPAIKIEKTDFNLTWDQDGHVEDDSQTVLSWNKAVFKIIVTNIGGEDLKNVVITDSLAPNCSKTADETKSLYSGDVFAKNDSFHYLCEIQNPSLLQKISDGVYKNTISVTAVWVTSNQNVNDNDPTIVKIEWWHYDLALKKTVVNAKTGYNIWDIVEYKISVYNQWNVDAHNIEITDYIPEHMELQDGNGWSAMSADRKTKQTIASIPAWGQKDLTIKLKILAGASGNIRNFAEISADDGDDCDSTPDDINQNTEWEKDGKMVDDSIWTWCGNWTDEDDHDVAVINIESPSCGTANGKTYPASTSSWPSGETFCSKWTPNPTNPSFPAQWWTTTWTCNLAWTSTACAASRWTSWWGGWWWGWWRYYCGDGDRIDESNLWKWTYEECDEWRNNNWNVNHLLHLSDIEWNKRINYYKNKGLTWRAEELEKIKWQPVYCSSSCKIVPVKKTVPCAVSGTCPPWHCGVLNWKTITPTQLKTFIDNLDHLWNYAQYFCNPKDSVLWFEMNQTLWANEFVWHCGVTKCSMRVSQVWSWFIKVYGSYKNPWSCPECLGFDEETTEWIRRKFLANYDTEYTRSIMQGDYLPIWFKLKGDNYIKQWEDCNATTEWKRDFTTFNVKFTIDGNPESFVVWNLKAFPDRSVMWQAYLPASETTRLSPWVHTIRWYLTKINVCKWYDTDGDGVKDDYRWEEETMNELFATQKFTVTTNYMIQVGTALSSVSNIDPNIDGKTLQTWWVPVATTSISYNKTDITNAISNFVNKYKQYATIPNNTLFVDHTITWKKVPTQEIYYIDASTQWGFVKIWGSVSKPTTVIVENGDAIIEWDISWPLMLVVKNGKIKINNENMNKRTFMEWYYFTDKGFEVVGPAITHSDILNKDPSSPIWYADGRLVVKWVLIWQNADRIYSRRRSVLKNRFRTGFGPAYAVRNGASLTIVPSNTLWANPPVWSKDLFQMLKVSLGN